MNPLPGIRVSAINRKAAYGRQKSESAVLRWLKPEHGALFSLARSDAKARKIISAVICAVEPDDDQKIDARLNSAYYRSVAGL
jgi:hypothetical protein